MAMSTLKAHVVKPGEYLASLAHRFGFDADTIWADPKNKELADKRDPNVLAPGDILFFPQEDESALGTIIKIICEDLNPFAATVPTVPVELVFVDHEGKPIANEPFEVIGASAPPAPPTTGADGTAKFEVTV